VGPEVLQPHEEPGLSWTVTDSTIALISQEL
jgi:hypothetical protein